MSPRALVLAVSLSATSLAATHDTGLYVVRITTVAIESGTRLLVIAPHPDDEVIAAGGLIQRVRAIHGAVRVVYLTDGESYREGVKVEEHVKDPRSSDYR